MKHVALTLVIPIAEGRREALEAAIAALGEGPESPFARVPGMHVGRLAIIDRLEDPRGDAAPRLGPYLYFTADADGPYDAAVASIATHFADLFRHCAGCPERRDSRALDKWLGRHRVRDGWTIMPYSHHTLAECRDGLSVRQRMAGFAVAAQTADPLTLRARFLEELG